MKLYSKKNHRYVERQVHFGIGQSVKTACGLILFSRHIMVSLFSNSDGSIITDDLTRVTCKRCLATRETRLRKLMAIERAIPGVFDHETLCGEQWLLNHALTISKEDIEAQRLEINVEGKELSLSNKLKSKDRREILHNLVRGK